MTDPGLNYPKLKTKFIASDSTKNPSCFSGNQLESYLYGKKTVLPIDVEEMRQKSEEKVASGGKSEEETTYSQGKTDGQCTAHDPLRSLRKLVHAKDQGKAYDEIQHTYAVTSFPDEVQLCISSIPGINYGVCAKQDLPSGTWIGPYEGRRTVNQRLMAKEDHECRWEIYEEGKFSHFIDGSDYSASSWMRFICSARSAKEQNMAAYQYGQNIYYRSLRDIPVGEELLVWYSDSYLKHLGIPMVLKETEQLNIHESTQHWNDWEVASNHPGTLVSKLPSTRCITSKLPSSELSEHIPKTVEQAHDPKSLKSTARSSSQSLKPVVPTIQETLANQIRERRERLNSLSEGPTAKNIQELSENSPSELAKFSFSETAYQECYADSRIFKTAMEENSRFETSLLGDVSSPFKCKQCFKVFTQRIQLQMHVCPKSPYKPFQCGHCSSSFAQPSELRNHVVVHTSERPFKCGFCGRSFAGATTLNNHMRTHTGEKPFRCNKCGKTFSIATQLARHARMPGECTSYVHFDSA